MCVRCHAVDGLRSLVPRKLWKYNSSPVKIPRFLRHRIHLQPLPSYVSWRFRLRIRSASSVKCMLLPIWNSCTRKPFVNQYVRLFVFRTYTCTRSHTFEKNVEVKMKRLTSLFYYSSLTTLSSATTELLYINICWTVSLSPVNFDIWWYASFNRDTVLYGSRTDLQRSWLQQTT